MGRFLTVIILGFIFALLYGYFVDPEVLNLVKNVVHKIAGFVQTVSS